MNIDDSIIKKTNCCSKKHQCIKNPEYLNRIEVEKCVGEDILFMKCNGNKCSYSIRFGESITCICPVRKQIYKEYGK